MKYINPSTQCDMCRISIGDEFVDGATKMGSWANMCPHCHMKHGIGIGVGKGQRYHRAGKDFFKVS